MDLQNTVPSTVQLTEHANANTEKRHPNQGIINDLRADQFRPAEENTVTSLKPIMQLYRCLQITQCISRLP
jgi:hypothetical protein